MLQINIGGGTLYGGSGAQYFVGEFDGETFTADGDPARFAAPAPDLVADFEGDDYGDWDVTGTAFGEGPAGGALEDQQQVGNFLGDGFANSFSGGDASQGTLTSPPFEIARSYLNLLVGGGAHAGETAINLLLGGEVVRTATGEEGEWLDWHSWDVREFEGQEARVEIVDRQSEAWGHISVDHIVQSDMRAEPLKARARWVDYGKDFYAAISWENLPQAGDRQAWLGWMSNWQYAQDVPTYLWRSAQSVPRTLSLETHGGEVRLVQRPVEELRTLRAEHADVKNRPLQAGSTFQPDIKEETLEIVAEFELGDSSEVGLKVRVGKGEETLVGYDVKGAEMFIDRRKSV